MRRPVRERYVPSRVDSCPCFFLRTPPVSSKRTHTDGPSLWPTRQHIHQTEGKGGLWGKPYHRDSSSHYLACRSRTHPRPLALAFLPVTYILTLALLLTTETARTHSTWHAPSTVACLDSCDDA